MYPSPCEVPFEERKMFSVDFADDKSVLMRIMYIGDEASGIIDIASTGDITFKHGDASSEVADTDTKLDAGGLGVIDVSADITDYHSLQMKINSSDNWRCVLVGALPDADPHTTTTGHFTEVTGGDCTIDGGYEVLTDDSDSKYIVAGMTWAFDHQDLHFTDHGVVHVLTRVIAKSTYGSGTSSLLVYACNDDDGTKRLLKTFTAGATTAQVAYPAETTPATEPHAVAKGERLAVILQNSAAMGTVRLKAEGFSYRAHIGRSKWPVDDLD